MATKAIAEILNPGDVEVKMTLVFSLHDWDEIRKALQGKDVGWNASIHTLTNSIMDLTHEINKKVQYDPSAPSD